MRHAHVLVRLTVTLLLLTRIRTDSPVGRINSALHKPMKARIRPILHAVYVPVFDGVPVNIFNVFFEVTVVADLVFPEATLPQAQFITALLRFRPRGCVECTRLLTHAAFDDVPARGIVGIVFGQGPDAMQVIG